VRIYEEQRLQIAEKKEEGEKEKEFSEREYSPTKK